MQNVTELTPAESKVYGNAFGCLPRLYLQCLGPNDQAWHTLSSEEYETVEAREAAYRTLSKRRDQWLSCGQFTDHNFRIAHSRG